MLELLACFKIIRYHQELKPFCHYEVKQIYPISIYSSHFFFLHNRSLLLRLVLLLILFSFSKVEVAVSSPPAPLLTTHINFPSFGNLLPGRIEAEDLVRIRPGFKS